MCIPVCFELSNICFQLNLLTCLYVGTFEKVGMIYFFLIFCVVDYVFDNVDTQILS